MAQITEDYVSFEIAKLLKEKGFDEVCYRIYDTKEGKLLGTDGIEFQNHEADEETITAPTLQMAMKWLREVYEIDIIIFRHIRGKRTTFFDRIEKRTHLEHQSKCNLYLSYEQACKAAIKYCLEKLL